jgi:HAE1 family hydrophobic/amphiphilic exporter-1
VAHLEHQSYLSPAGKEQNRDRFRRRQLGLSAKNAILIVEFAKQSEEAGANPLEAAMRAARTRLRPILMTSLAFVFGVVPLAIATGAGSEMRQVLGTAMFFGMLGVTVFGLVFTPIFYVGVRRLSEIGRQAAVVPHVAHDVINPAPISRRPVPDQAAE